MESSTRKAQTGHVRGKIVFTLKRGQSNGETSYHETKAERLDELTLPKKTSDALIAHMETLRERETKEEPEPPD